MRVLVTGGGGFVGRHVLDRARKAGHGAISTEGDLRDPGTARSALAATSPDAVIHLAAAAPAVGAAAPWAALIDEVRIAGNLITAIRDYAPEVPLVIPGSAAQYGMGSQRRISEQAPSQPISSYGAIKCALEGVCLAPSLNDGVRVVWARLFNLLGPGQAQEAPTAGWARQVAEAEIARGGELRTGNLDVVRDFLDVRDAADALLALAKAPAAAGPVNVCSGTPTRLGELAGALATLTDVPLKTNIHPALLRDTDPPYVVGDPSRLRELTGWRPSIELVTSLSEMLDEWRERVGVRAAEDFA